MAVARVADDDRPQHGGKEPAFPASQPAKEVPDVEELRKELIVQRQRASDLERQLQEITQQVLRSPTAGVEAKGARKMDTSGSSAPGDAQFSPRSPSWLHADAPPRNQPSPTGDVECSDFPGRDGTGGSQLRSAYSGPDSGCGILEQMLQALPALPAFGTEGFVATMLVATEQLLGAEDVGPAVNAWMDRREHLRRIAPTQPARRTQGLKFGDGIDKVRSCGLMRRIDLYAKEYVPPTDVWGMVDGLARWCTPKGVVWPARAIEDLTRNCRLVAGRQTAGGGDNVLVPLFVYTSALYNRPLWCVWVQSANQWKELPRSHLLEAAREGAAQQGRESFRADRDAIADVATVLDCHQADLSTNMRPRRALPHGLSAWQCSLRTRRKSTRQASHGAALEGAERQTSEQAGDRGSERSITLVRYVAGRGELSPLADSVAWLPSYEDAFEQGPWALASGRLPPPGIFEYIESRTHGEVYEGAGWNVSSAVPAAHEAIIAECYAEPNQNRYNSVLHAKLSHVLDETPAHGDSAVRRKAMDAKLEHDDGRPVPQTIAHALELQQLRYGGRDYIIALSGFPRVVVDTATLGIVSVHRVYHEHDEQPYLLLNGTMRAVQDNSHQAWLDVLPSAGTALAGRYCAQLPAGSELRHDTDPHRTVKWDPFLQSWVCGVSTRVSNGDTKLHLGTWMLDELRPMMYFLDRSLAEIPCDKGTVKSYRGLADAMLPHDLYHTGALVVWASFSSSSADQATATWFATQGGSAAVFTLRGHSCRLIAPWSRFSREMEWLYPAGCCFQVKTMLTEDQQQILGREELQLYEVDEVDEVEALTIFVTAHINAAITRDEGFAKVNQLVGIIQPLLCKDLRQALQQAVRPDRPFILDSEGVDMSLRLCELARSAKQPVDCEDILNKALVSAAHDGLCSAIPNLVQIGANLSATDEQGLPVFEVAVRGGHTETARCLLQLGCSRRVMDEVGPQKVTMLHRMAALGEQHAVACLLNLGADPTARDSQGRTPAVCAYERGHKTVVRLLNPEETLPMEVLEDFWAATPWRSEHGEARTRFGEGAAHPHPFAQLTYKPHFWSSDYQPSDVWDVVCDLANWQTPQGPAYSDRAVDDLVANCRLTDARHSQGQTSDVVVPLYVHTSSVYRSEVWLLWDPQLQKHAQSLAGWKVIPRGGQLLSLGVPNVSGQHEAVTISPRLLRHDIDVSTSGAVPCYLCGRPSSQPMPDRQGSAQTTVSRRNTPGELLVPNCSPQESPTCARSDCLNGPDKVRMPVLVSTRNIVGFGWPAGRCVVRYTSQNDDAPIRGAVAWVPAPDVLFGKGPMRVGSMPPSSVLEYIFSRPEDAALEQRSRKGGSMTTQWRCSRAVRSPEALALQDSCAQHRNQNQFDKPLFDRFNALLPLLAGDEERVSHELLQVATEAKLCGRRRPTPEVLAHALSLQCLEEKAGRKWILSLSGEPRVMVHGETLQTASVFRVCSPHLPSPSEHADTALRALRSGQGTTSLEVHPTATTRSNLAGVYVDPASMSRERDAAQTVVHSDRDSRASGERDSLSGTRSRMGPMPATPQAQASLPQSPLESMLRERSHSVGTVAAALASPRSSRCRTQLAGWRTPMADSQHNLLLWAGSFKRITGPQHSARWDADQEAWTIQPEAVRYGASTWTSKRTAASVTLLPEETTLHMGTWMLGQVQPLLYFVYRALETLPRASHNFMCFRATGAVPRDVLTEQSVLFWDSVSVSSSARSVATAHLSGDEAEVSVFRIVMRSGRYIAPWSRLSRELEYMLPAQSILQVAGVVGEPRSGVVVFDMMEIDDAAALVLFIREMIKRPPPGEGAPAYVTQLFRVIAAVESGSLDQALAMTVRPERPVLLSEAGVEIAERCLALGANLAVVSVALREAAREGLTRSVEKLLQVGGDPDFGDERGEAPLELAVLGGHVDTVRALIRDPSELLFNLDPAEPPLHRRAVRGQPLAVYTLLQLGADPAQLDSSGRTAAHCAHQVEQTFCVYVLFYGDSSGTALPDDLAQLYTDSLATVLRMAVETAAVEAAMAFVLIGADPVSAPDQHGHTALHHAARVGAFNSGVGLQVVRHMAVAVPLAHAACDSARQTPLHEAAEYGNAATAAVLLQAGADPHALDVVGNTPLALAEGEETQYVLRRAMEQAMAEAEMRLQRLPGEPAAALDRLADTLADPSTGNVSASEIAIVGFGGTLRAVRCLLDRLQGPNVDTTGEESTNTAPISPTQHRGSLGEVRTPWAPTIAPVSAFHTAVLPSPAAPREAPSEMFISAAEFRVRFVSWGPPDESDSALLDRIHSWLGNLGALDGQNAMRWVQQREQQVRTGIARDEADVRRGWQGKQARLAKQAAAARRGDRFSATPRLRKTRRRGVFLSPDQLLQDQREAFWRPFRPVWGALYLCAVMHVLVTIPLFAAFGCYSNLGGRVYEDAIFYVAIAVQLLRLDWAQWIGRMWAASPTAQAKVGYAPRDRRGLLIGRRPPAHMLVLFAPVSRRALLLLGVQVLAALPLWQWAAVGACGAEQLLRMNRLLGLLHAAEVCGYIREQWLAGPNPAQLRYAGTALAALFILHLLTCLYGHVAESAGGPAYEPHCAHSGGLQRYPRCLRGTLTLVTGWAQRWPLSVSDGEVVFFLFSSLLGVLGLTWYFNTVSNLLERWNLRRQEYHNAVQSIDAWLSHSGAGKSLRRDVERYFRFLWRTERASHLHFFDFLVDEVGEHAPSLARELRLALYLSVLREVPFFANFETDVSFMHEVVQGLQLHLGVPGSVLCEEGSAATCMFFIASGVVEIYVDGFLAQGQYHDGRRVATLTAGDYFGEVALLQDTARSASAVSLTDTRMYVLERGNAFDRIRKYPAAFAALIDAMSKRKRSLEALKPRRQPGQQSFAQRQPVGRELRLASEESLSTAPQGPYPTSPPGADAIPAQAGTTSLRLPAPHSPNKRSSAAFGPMRGRSSYRLRHLEQLLRSTAERRLSDSLGDDDGDPGGSVLLPRGGSPLYAPPQNIHRWSPPLAAFESGRSGTETSLSRVSPTAFEVTSAPSRIASNNPLLAPGRRGSMVLRSACRSVEDGVQDLSDGWGSDDTDAQDDVQSLPASSQGRVSPEPRGFVTDTLPTDPGLLSFPSSPPPNIKDRRSLRHGAGREESWAERRQSSTSMHSWSGSRKSSTRSAAISMRSAAISSVRSTATGAAPAAQPPPTPTRTTLGSGGVSEQSRAAAVVAPESDLHIQPVDTVLSDSIEV
eukprot:TRINITY_DN6247_c1_g2_i3.p1 TRINITY_DN6247_c1_g2~~TRINITY_DN6247_c1_g2_i3.p1  ORF type:complete len:3258 (+),score=947.81 TRINITY_DN6247_c1_g2_i3:81-9776(+)